MPDTPTKSDALDGLGRAAQRGVEAAGALVDQLVNLVDGALGGDQQSGGDTARSTGRASAADAAHALVELCQRVIAEAVDSPALGGRAGDDLGSTPGAGHRVEFTADVATEVWLHNRTADRLSDTEVLATSLVSNDGHEIAANRVCIAPERLVDVAARSSRSVKVHVDAADANPGTYFGLLVVRGIAAEPVQIVVTVP